MDQSTKRQYHTKAVELIEAANDPDLRQRDPDEQRIIHEIAIANHVLRDQRRTLLGPAESNEQQVAQEQFHNHLLENAVIYQMAGDEPIGALEPGRYAEKLANHAYSIAQANRVLELSYMTEGQASVTAEADPALYHSEDLRISNIVRGSDQVQQGLKDVIAGDYANTPAEAMWEIKQDVIEGRSTPLLVGNKIAEYGAQYKDAVAQDGPGIYQRGPSEVISEMSENIRAEQRREQAHEQMAIAADLADYAMGR